MNLDFTREELDFRQEVDEFTRRELPPDWDNQIVFWPGGYGTIPIFETEFQEVAKAFSLKLHEKGWTRLAWPEKYGGEASVMKAAIVGNVLSYHRAPAGGVASSIVAPSIILVGSEEQKKEFLPKIADGRASFWLAYSEPNAGSDLAALKTSAVEDGDDYIINGQKIWSSGAHVTEYAWPWLKQIRTLLLIRARP